MAELPRRAVVFGYHNVGVRGLSALLALGVDVRLVVTHEDNPSENLWFQSIAELAVANDIPVIKPANPNDPSVVEQVRACQPHWIFSFYYRHMLGVELLGIPIRGAFNLHGSLLPRYRGRVPINWAVLHGERETGASLHRMGVKPDAGPLVDQQAVSILPNDTAYDVFQKVTCAAEEVLLRSIPRLLDGSARETPLDLAAGNYFGGRRPEDGRIDWQAGAWQIHNLIRAVAPPYPGAFFDHQAIRVEVLGSYYRAQPALGADIRIYWQGGKCWADCSDGKRLLLTRLAVAGEDIDQPRFQRYFDTTDLKLNLT